MVKGTMSLPVADMFSHMLYCFKFGLKDKYFKCLEKLKPVLDDDFYNYLWNFGMSSIWLKKGGV